MGTVAGRFGYGTRASAAEYNQLPPGVDADSCNIVRRERAGERRTVASRAKRIAAVRRRPGAAADPDATGN
jgi:hypothetical protein